MSKVKKKKEGFQTKKLKQEIVFLLEEESKRRERESKQILNKENINSLGEEKSEIGSQANVSNKDSFLLKIFYTHHTSSHLNSRKGSPHNLFQQHIIHGRKNQLNVICVRGTCNVGVDLPCSIASLSNQIHKKITQKFAPSIKIMTPYQKKKN